MKTIYMDTLGCSKNQVDSDRIRALLEKKGYHFVQENEAELILLNTCGFIEPAVREGIDRILELSEYKQEKCKRLVVMGCMAERYKEELERELPEVDAFLGTGYLEGVVDFLEGKKKTGYEARDHEEKVQLLPFLPTKHSAFLKIAEGCDNHCSYCLIPKLRGTFRSRAVDEIVREAKAFSRLGVKELILIAQDTSRYGLDIGTNLITLLKELDQIEGIEWIRLEYVYPDKLDDTIIEELSKLKKFVPYFDIPIQHVSNRILKLMNRHTDKESIESVLQSIRRHFKESAIRTSIIVGFPSETDEDFHELLTFIEEHPFDRLGTFTYWDEEGSASSKLPEKVDQETKERRRDILMTKQESISEELLSKRVGKIYDVLVDEPGIARSAFESPEVDGIISIEPDIPVGSFVKVKITSNTEHDLVGEVL
ncbi:30S ribosomal protein S12 methylthiotransferase RimO [Guggenheimella bovis]